MELRNTPNRSMFVEIYDQKKMQDRIQDVSNSDKDQATYITESNIRIKIQKPRGEIIAIKKQLIADFPNFDDAINKIFSGLLVGLLSDTRGLYFPPVLLVGDPGIGKTFFTKALSNALGLKELAIDLSTSTSSMILAGSSSRWGNCAPGLIAKSLIKNKMANQLVRLDELDKTNKGKSTSSSFGGEVANSLITLLEHHSAKEFVDEWFEVAIDASHLSYIATANTLTTIEPHILSRFTVAKVEKLTKDQMKSVVKRVYLNLLDDLEIDSFTSILSADIIDAFAEMGDVRSLKAGLMAGLMSCVERDGDHVILSDVTPYIDDILESRKPKTVGFI